MKHQIMNPILPQNEYIPDVEAHVFGERVYLYGSHDLFNGGQFCLGDYTVWSAPLNDMSDWTNHGVSYRKDQDPYYTEGSFMQAPDAVQGPDGRFYLYYALALKPFVSVAVSDRPEGPFEFYGLVRDRQGTPLGLRPHDVFMFDPGVFRDEDGQVYLYCGFNPEPEGFFAAAAKKFRMDGSYAFSLEDDMLTVHHEYGRIFAGDFYEASSMRKFDGKYYFIYSSKAQHELRWAVGDSPAGSFTEGGVLISNGDLGYRGNTVRKNYTGNNHGSVEKINGEYLVFYHRQTNGNNYSRQVCAEPICFHDGVFEQAQMTSSGINPVPLKGEGTYPARIACNLWSKDGSLQYGVSSTPGIEDHPCFTQNEDGVQYIANMREGATAGFKYFDLKDDARIIPNFSGKGHMDIQVCSGALYFTYHGTDAASFYGFTIEA